MKNDIKILNQDQEQKIKLKRM